MHEAESAAGRVKDGSKPNTVDYALLKEVKEKVSSPPKYLSCSNPWGHLYSVECVNKMEAKNFVIIVLNAG